MSEVCNQGFVSARLAGLLKDQALLSIFAALDEPGEETRVVGGAVRDAMLGRRVHEIDLTTTHLPQRTLALAEAAGLKAIPTGIEHGTLTLISGGRPFEVTSLREDIITDGRHAIVRFGRDFQKDALRRDFTINALSLSHEGHLFDYAGGLADLEARKVRFIGEPETRIKEDYLRILRFFRFSAEYGEGLLDKPGRLAAIRHRAGLCLLSRERIGAELQKLLCARCAAKVIGAVCEDGLLHPLLGLAANPARLARGIAYETEAAPDPLLRLGALCVLLPEDASRLQDKLRLSNAQMTRLAAAATTLISLHGRDQPPGEAELRVMLFRQGRQGARDGLFLAQSEARPGQEGAWRKAWHFLAVTEEPRFPFSGADLIAHGIPAGPTMGKALQYLQESWTEAGFPLDKVSLSQLLDSLPHRSK
ncbi:MAG: CCA tRNA nucleotidyltransferase [Alphaproteobacteria bacterium]|nr:CCA tRNA nucleotidyltransferase [Alphaproteobacteria bacterium]